MTHPELRAEVRYPWSTGSEGAWLLFRDACDRIEEKAQAQGRTGVLVVTGGELVDPLADEAVMSVEWRDDPCACCGE